MFCADLTAKFARFYQKERKVVMLILPQIHRFYVIFREFFTQSYTEFFLNWIVLRELHRGVALDKITNDAI